MLALSSSLPVAQRGGWGQGEFRKFWLSVAISDFGSAITTVALPLTAIVTLDAGAAQMGLLVGMGQLPVPLFGLFAGVWVDRVRRRPLMMWADGGRALVLASVPLAAVLGVLTLAQLYVVAFVIGTLTVLFDLGSTSYLPTLVGRAALLESNSRLQMTHQVSAVLGRGAGGALVQALTAPLAIAVDAVSFALSGIVLAFIRQPEERASDAGHAGMWRQIGEGLRATLREPVIAAMTISSTLGAMGGAVQQAVLFLFMTRTLDLPPRTVGVVMAAASLAAWLGARYARPAARRFGHGRAMILASFISLLGYALVPLAGLGAAPARATLILGQAAAGLALTLYSVNQISLRQLLTPDALLGRVNATRRVFVFGSIPIGAVVGGALGEWLGLREALWAASALIALSALYTLASPLRRVPVDLR